MIDTVMVMHECFGLIAAYDAVSAFLDGVIEYPE
jgi:hypothetical protein